MKKKIIDIKHKQWERIYDIIEEQLDIKALIDHTKALQKISEYHGVETVEAYENGLKSAILLYVSNYVVYERGPA